MGLNTTELDRLVDNLEYDMRRANGEINQGMVDEFLYRLKTVLSDITSNFEENLRAEYERGQEEASSSYDDGHKDGEIEGHENALAKVERQLQDVLDRDAYEEACSVIDEIRYWY